MANGADGSIIIDTRLDNTGFKQGSKRMEAATESLTGKMNTMGQQMTRAAQASIPALQNAGKAAQQTAQMVQQAGQNTQAFSSQMDDAISSTDFSKGMDAAGRSCTTLANQLQRLGESQRMGINTQAQMTRFQINTDKARDSVDQLREKLAAMASQKVMTPEYEELAASAQKAEQALFRMYDRRDVMQELGVRDTSREWQRLDLQIRNAEANLQRYESGMRNLQATGGAYTLGINTAQYQQTSAMLQQMISNLQWYEQVAAGFNTVQQPAAQSHAALKSVDEELQQKPGDASRASSAMSRFGGVLKSVAGTALRLVGTLARVSFSTLAKGAKAAAAGIKNLSKRNGEASLTSQGLVKALTSVKRMLLSRIKQKLITSIMQYMREGMQSLAQYSSAFDASMSSIQNSVRGLSGNLAVSFSSIVNALAPVITSIINMLSKAITYINSFFALISGKSTVTIAKKQTDSYAKSLGGAAGAAEELKNQVYGFDELNKASDDSSSGGGGGGGSSGGGIEYEDVPIDTYLPETVRNFFDSIMSAFKAGDWEGIGQIVATGFNSVIDSVDDWINKTLRPLAVTWTERVARILNGFVDGLDWQALGTLFADGINTIFDVANTFLTTFDFGALGVGIGKALNGAISGIDWALVAQTFANKWNAAIYAIQGIVQTVDWAGVGSAIATGIDAWFSTIDWNAAGVAISDGIKGLLLAINTVLAETDWQAIGQDIATFIAAIDWSGIVSALSEGIGAALGGLSAILWGIIKGAWDSVVQWWHDNAYVDGQFTIEGLLSGLWTAICNIGQWIVDNIFTPFINGFKSAFGIASPSTVMEEQGGFIIDGLLNGIKAAWSSITEWFSGVLDGLKTLLSNAWDSIKSTATTVWTNIKTGVTTTFTNLKTSLTTLATNIKTSLSTSWTNIKTAATQAWTSLKTSVSTLFTNLKTSLSTVATNIKTSLSTAWTNIKTTATTAWTNLKTSVSSAFTSLKTSVTTTATNLKTSLSTAWTNIKTTATTAWTNLKTSVSTAFTNLKTTLSTTATNLKTSLSTAWTNIKTTATTTWTGISSWISSTFTNLKSTLSGIDWTGIGSNVLSGMKSGIANGWDTVKNWVTSKFSGLVSSVKNLFGIHSPSRVFENIGELLMSGLRVGLNGESGSVFSKVSDIATAITDEMSSGSPEISLVGNAVTTGIERVADKLAQIASVFSAIADALTAMGGLQVPSVAAGEVIPYKTRVVQQSPSTGDSSGFTAFSENFDETMSDQRDLLRQIRDLLERLDLVVDGESLMRALLSLQRSQARSYGGA